MQVKFVLNKSDEINLEASSVKVDHGFFQFKNVSIGDGPKVEEAWIPVSLPKLIVWIGKPEEEEKDKDE